MPAIADRLDLSPAFVEGVTSSTPCTSASPPGRYLLQVCTTLSCQLCGTGELVDHLKHKLGIDFGETTADGRFTLVDVQCLGACGEAPVIQVNNDYYDELDVDAARRAARRARVGPGGDHGTHPAARPRHHQLPVDRHLPRGRRLRALWTRRSAMEPADGHRGGQEVRAARPRRRRLPDRRQVGLRAQGLAQAEVPDLQRRRVRAGHLQGPRDHPRRSRTC